MEKYKYLMNLTKILSENFRLLHRNVVGNQWFGAHEKMSEYYEKLDEIQDSVVEIGIMLGCVEQSVTKISDVFPTVKEGAQISETQVYEYSYNFLHELMRAIENVKDEVPGDVYSELEPYIFWARLEADYKIKRRLMGK